jgi:hypothetical protein
MGNGTEHHGDLSRMIEIVDELSSFVGDHHRVNIDVALGKDEKAKALELAHERETKWTDYKSDEKGEVIFNPVEPPDWR